MTNHLFFPGLPSAIGAPGQTSGYDHGTKSSRAAAFEPSLATLCGRSLRIFFLSFYPQIVQHSPFSRDGFSDNEVAFQATFSDGTQGIHVIEVPPASEELRVTVVSFSGSELRLSFPATSGRSYVIESRADLSVGDWAEVPGDTTIGNGTVIQLILPIALAQPQQFFRVKQLP